jgi:hypothetical protein
LSKKLSRYLRAAAMWVAIALKGLVGFWGERMGRKKKEKRRKKKEERRKKKEERRKKKEEGFI